MEEVKNDQTTCIHNRGEYWNGVLYPHRSYMANCYKGEVKNERRRLVYKKQHESGECAKCYKDAHGTIQTCEIEGHCKYDKEAVRDWERILWLI